VVIFRVFLLSLASGSFLVGSYAWSHDKLALILVSQRPLIVLHLGCSCSSWLSIAAESVLLAFSCVVVIVVMTRSRCEMCSVI
jgi:hypothetical protein